MIRRLLALTLGAGTLTAALACDGGHASAADSARRDSARADSGPRPSATGAADTSAATISERSLDAYAAHLDSLERRDEVRLLFTRVDPESDDSWGAEGWYAGDTLVLVRGDIPGDSVGAVTYYLRDGGSVLATVAPDGPESWVPGRTLPPAPKERFYMRGDSIAVRRGDTLPIDARRLAASLGTLRAQLAAAKPDAFPPGDSIVPRPVAPYVIPGACPFECCRYGKWTVLGGVALRAAQSSDAPVVGHVASGTAVLADSGDVIVDTIGVVAMTGMTSDLESGRTFAKGDTLLLLDYQGEGYRGAWLRGHSISVADFWSETGVNGAKLVRAPHAAWWAHLSVPRAGDTLRGWVNMTADSVRVSGSDACGG